MTDWTEYPSAASRLVHRAMQERGWKDADVAMATGLDRSRINRWKKSRTNPTDADVAIAAARLGYEPQDFGITAPTALAAAATIQPMQTTSAPAWAVAHHLELLDRIDALAKLLTDECEHVHALETEIVNHLRGA